MGEKVNTKNIGEISHFAFVLIVGIILGLILNWLSIYMIISMGFVGIGIGPTASLIISKLIFKKWGADTRPNLALVGIIFSATAAAEAAVGMLYLIWLFGNASLYNITFDAPSWLLPSAEVFAAKNIFSPEWILPMFTHYFLMIVPGLIGLTIGWMIKNKFVNNTEEYPFPGVIRTHTSVEALTDKADTKGRIFAIWGIVGFLFALFTLPISVIDLSSTKNGYLLGIFLGPIGITLLSAGFIMNRPKITNVSIVVSILAYSVLSIFLIGSHPELGFFEYFNEGVKNVYFSVGIGILLGGMLFGPIIWGIIKARIRKRRIRKKNQNQEYDEESDSNKLKKSANDNNPVKIMLETQNNRIITKKQNGISEIFKRNWKGIIIITVLFMISMWFVFFLDTLQGNSFLVVFLVMFWILILGGFVNGYIMTQGSAKMGMGFIPPFIFTMLPIYFTNTSGIVPYLVTPTAEPDGTRGIIYTQKLASLNNIKPKVAFIAYLVGYIASTITTPLFSLVLWNTFGIGTESLPAPSFPVNGAIMAAFASNDIGSFLNLGELLIALILSFGLAYFNVDLAIAVVIGIFFPPHMAIMLTLGGIARIWYTKKHGKSASDDKGVTMATGLAVGGSFVILIQILLVWLI